MVSNSQERGIDEDLKPTRRFDQSSADGDVEDFIETKRGNSETLSESKAPLGLQQSEDGAEATTMDAAKYGVDTASVGPGNPFLSGETASQGPPPSQQVVTPDFLMHKYEIGVEIDRGGMGRVFSATEKDSGDKVVVKVLSFMGKSDRRLVRFHREAGALSLFSHEHILHLRDFGVHWEDAQHGVPYLITEAIPGPNLQSIVRESLRATKKGPDVDWLIKHFQGVAEALVECHKTGIIHRDIKPANIVIDEESDRAVLIDFGLSKADPEVFQDSISAFKESLTATGQVLGTPLYMAPEQLFGVRHKVGPGSDVWGFAATFFYCLTGRLPFDVESPLDLVDAMETEDPPPVRQFNESAPEWLEALLQDCFQKDVTLRPTMNDVAMRIKTLHANEAANRFAGGRLLWLAAIPVLVLLLYGLWPKQSAPALEAPRLLIDSVPATTKSATFQLKGEVEGQGPFVVHIVSNEHQAPEMERSVEDKRFEAVLTLRSGLNSFTIYVVNGEQKKSKVKTIRITRKD